jgi:hypothetical protein
VVELVNGSYGIHFPEQGEGESEEDDDDDDALVEDVVYPARAFC